MRVASDQPVRIEHMHYDDYAQAFSYTLVQEKATQLFYQQLAHAASEPVLRQI